MTRALVFSTVCIAGAASLLSACAGEEYFCDDTGCYYCDGLSCREVDPPGACVTSAECAASGFACLDGECTAVPGACVTDEGCATNQRCIAGVCEDRTDLCQFNYECPEGELCVNARCHATCNLDMPCIAPLVCTDGICIDDPAICVRNRDCGTNNLCVDGACRPECGGGLECGDGFYCREGICRYDGRPAAPFCTTEAQCMPGHPCVNGVCRTPCETHAECLRFDVQFNYCLDNLCVTTNEATSNCTIGTECGAHQACIDGICR